MKKKQLIREKFRTDVFTRDGYKCKFCDIIKDLDAHHITDRSKMPNGGYVKENGITLCKDHHLLAEEFHITDGQNWFENMHPNDLYKAIGSTLDEAIRKSERLE